MTLKSLLLALHAALFGILLAVSPAGSGSMTLLGVGKVASVAPAYTGPGDVVGSAVGWWGLRAYSNAAIGTNAFRVQRDDNSATLDVPTIAGGGVNSAAIATFLSSPTTTGSITILYDQTGNGHNAVASAGISGSQIILSGIGSLPVMRAPNALANQVTMTVTLGSAVSQPFTTVAIARRTANFTSEQYYFGDVVSSVIIGGWRNTANTAFLNAGGGNSNASATDSIFHSMIASLQGASSFFYIDGTGTALPTVGSDPLSAASGIMEANGQGNMIGDMMEFGIWSSAFTGTQATNMKTNQQSYWGY